MSSQKGLTLVEILIAVSVIVILVIGGFFFFSKDNFRSAVDMNEPQSASSPTPAPGFSDIDEMIVTDEAATNNFTDNRDVSKNCPENFTELQTSGPYYKPGSPNRQSVIEEGISGEKITVTGYVYDRNCNPIANAWLDFWQADGNGNYDNRGFNLRGHQYTDSNGRYVLETVMPVQYSSRPPHIHLKLRAKERGTVFTSQLYFPGESKNNTDAIFNSSLVVSLSEDGQTAYYNFKIDTE